MCLRNIFLRDYCCSSIFNRLLAYSLVLIRAITGPVKRLAIAAKKMAVGDVDVDCTKMYNDDLGSLMDNFRDMADAIKEQARVADVIAKGDFTISSIVLMILEIVSEDSLILSVACIIDFIWSFPDVAISLILLTNISASPAFAALSFVRCVMKL